MSETVRVRFKRLESFGNYCNAEAEVGIEFDTAAFVEVKNSDICDAFEQATKAVDEQIKAAKDRRDAALSLDRETQEAHWEDGELRRASVNADAYRVRCHAPDGDLVRDLVDFDIYIPAGKSDYDASDALQDASAWLDELGITPELTVEVHGVIPSQIRDSYLLSQRYICLKGEAGSCWLPRAVVAEYAVTERAESFGVTVDPSPSR